MERVVSTAYYPSAATPHGSRSIAWPIRCSSPPALHPSRFLPHPRIALLCTKSHAPHPSRTPHPLIRCPPTVQAAAGPRRLRVHRRRQRRGVGPGAGGDAAVLRRPRGELWAGGGGGGGGTSIRACWRLILSTCCRHAVRPTAPLSSCHPPPFHKHTHAPLPHTPHTRPLRPPSAHAGHPVGAGRRLLLHGARGFEPLAGPCEAVWFPSLSRYS